MSDAGIRALVERVQHNCNVSDARHGADYSLCVYLMKMREYYRWEKGLPFGARLEKDRIGDWLQARERLWEDLEDADLEPLELDGECFDPFDAEAVNRRLEDRGLVYSGGLGHGAKPHFVLGDLKAHYQSEGASIYVISAEHARDLTAPPAMHRGGDIFVRRESLRRMLWEKLESWRWNRPDNALGRAFACYDFDTELDASLDAMTEHEIASLLLHERGEYQAGLILGEGWEGMLLDLSATSAEIMLRALRDHLADALVTLPALARANDAPAIHFYMGNLTHMGREIAPALELAYQTWSDASESSVFAELAARASEHWSAVGGEAIELHRRRGRAGAGEIKELIHSRTMT